MKKNTIRLLCLLLSIAIFSTLTGCAPKELRENYQLGEAALAAGRLADAAEFFAAAEGYKNSEKYMQTIYFEAMNCFDDGDYKTAAPVFEILARYEIQDAQLYAAVSGAYACLEGLDGAGARACLEGADPSHPEVAAAEAALDRILFADTVLIRPEYVAEELLSGEVAVEITNISDDPMLDELLYTMTSREAASVYAQYREYCIRAFAESFRDESSNYFSFVISDRTYYITNFYSLDGGITITIPRY